MNSNIKEIKPKPQKYSNIQVVNGGQLRYKPHESNIAGKYKKFDQELCDKYDKPARELVKQKLGEFVEDNPNIYEQDMILHHKKYKFLELQVCGSWINKQYSEKTIKIFIRKARYGLDTAFITFSKDLDWGYIYDRASFQNCKPKRVAKYSKIYVFELPKNKATFFYSSCLCPETFQHIKESE